MGIVTIPTNDLVFPNRNHYAPTFQRTGIYKSVFFAQTVRDWNSLTDSLISASECAEDSVIKFTFLVRAQ